jgi:dTMP kinase
MTQRIQTYPLISFEGIEGMGKTTNIQWVAQYLRQAQHQVIVTREPGGTPLAEQIRNVLLAEYQELVMRDTELLLLYAARLQHLNQLIQPARNQGQWVLCDRFSDATFAYQGGGRAVPKERIEALHQWSMGTLAPDYTFLFDGPVAQGLARIKDRSALDRFEQEPTAFFERVRQTYLDLAASDPKRYKIIDASQPLENVQQQLTAQLTIILDNLTP